MKSILWISDTFHLACQVAYCSNHFPSSSPFFFSFRCILGLNYGRLSCVKIPHDVPFHANALHKRCSPTMFLPSWDVLHETRHPPRVAMPIPSACRKSAAPSSLETRLLFFLGAERCRLHLPGAAPCLPVDTRHQRRGLGKNWRIKGSREVGR